MKKDNSSLVEQTQRDILKYISENKGNHLPKENDFVESLGVSRGVVREALSRLRALGIIETKRKKGMQVVAPEVFGVMKTIVSSGALDKESLRDLYQLRLMLEIGMADFVYLNKTDAGMKKLDSIVAEEVACEQAMIYAQTDEEKYEVAKKLTDIDFRFHSTLFELTGNKSLMDFQHILRHLFTLYIPKVRDDYHKRNVVSHVGLFNLLQTSSADSFRVAMRLHLKTQFDNMEMILENTSNK